MREGLQVDISPPPREMLFYGLTGGIASGKSTVSSLLGDLAIPIIDTDVLARKVVEPGQPALKQIVKNFGNDVLLPSGQLDRAKLAEIIFQNESKRRVLNKCTHPYIKRAVMFAALKHFLKGESATIVVSPLLYESGAYTKWMKRIIVVSCTEEQQVERLVARNSLSREAAIQRIRAQMPLKDKCERADFVLDNSGDREALKRQTFDLCVELNRLSMNQKMLRAFFIFLFTVAVIYWVISWVITSGKLLM